MKRILLALLLSLAVFTAFGEALFYLSNASGMALEKIPWYRKGSMPWVLEVETIAAGETRRLFSEGKEIRRWETSRAAKDGSSEERQIESGSLSARRVYSRDGDLLQEELYSGGKLTQKSLYEYKGSKLASITVKAADGTLHSTERYLYTMSGALREVRRTGTEPGVSRFIRSSSGIAQELEEAAGELFITRFDAHGRVAREERLRGSERISCEDFFYSPETHSLVSSIEELTTEKKSIKRGYDGDGRLAVETVSLNEKILEEIGYFRDENGHVIRKTRRGSVGFEEWRYMLDEDGATKREEYLLYGKLQKVTLEGESSARTEEIYHDGELFLRVYYAGDRKVKEEVFEKGSPIKTRSFE